MPDLYSGVQKKVKIVSQLFLFHMLEMEEILIFMQHCHLLLQRIQERMCLPHRNTNFFSSGSLSLPLWKSKNFAFIRRAGERGLSNFFSNNSVLWHEICLLNFAISLIFGFLMCDLSILVTSKVWKICIANALQIWFRTACFSGSQFSPEHRIPVTSCYFMSVW